MNTDKMSNNSGQTADQSLSVPFLPQRVCEEEGDYKGDLYHKLSSIFLEGSIKKQTRANLRIILKYQSLLSLLHLDRNGLFISVL